MKRITLLVSLLLVAMIALSACQQSAAAPTPTAAPQAQATTPPAATQAPTTVPAATTAPATTQAATTAPTQAPAATQAAAPQNPEVILATTTSTRDSGLLDVLLPDFKTKTGYNVKPIAVGTGAALQLGERGEADVLLVHAPESEETYMEAKHGTSRQLVMYNDFVIVGPEDDPAGIKGTKKASTALKMIADKQALYVSRGDDSGTHKMELALFKVEVGEPSGSWYQEVGQGMGETLRVASEKGGYTLTDRGTYLSLKDTLDLVVLVEGDPALLNIYSVVTVNPDKNDKINVEGAKAFADYMVAPETQAIIGKYGVDKYGEPLFTPSADKTYEQLQEGA